LGSALVDHPVIRAVSFTGSDSVGKRVAEACAARNVKCQTEMGGKNVGIVLSDADLTQAANLVAGGAFRFAGQKCTATSRVVVEKGVYADFQEALVKAAQALPVGDPAEAATAVGPVISMAAQQQIASAVEAAPFDRAYRGEVPTAGYFVPPTVLGRVSSNADVAQEELFGPVLAMMEAEDLEHAIHLANETRFGLSASLFTKNISSALNYIGRIEAGMVRVNGDTTGVDPHAPFGGLKGSSSHSREQGPAAKEFFTELKTVQINP
jgi:alpha-ketoglutaric semialdehyde dehydrogenase